MPPVCPRCEYDLTALAGVDRCPECGSAIDASAYAALIRRKRRGDLIVRWAFLLSPLLGVALFFLTRWIDPRRSFASALAPFGPLILAGTWGCARWFARKHPEHAWAAVPLGFLLSFPAGASYLLILARIVFMAALVVGLVAYPFQ
jgi:hypothetical protein